MGGGEGRTEHEDPGWNQFMALKQNKGLCCFQNPLCICQQVSCLELGPYFTQYFLAELWFCFFHKQQSHY